MKKIVFIATIILWTINTNAQDVIIGQTKIDTLQKTPYSNWFLKTHESYTPNSKVVKELSHIFNKEDFEVEVYFGSWCSDSQREVPKLVKLLQLAEFDISKLKLIGVDRDKVVPGVSEDKRKELDITNVPTIIVYQKGRELNRFVEYAQETLEEDLLKIFSKKSYKHSYQF